MKQERGPLRQPGGAPDGSRPSTADAGEPARPQQADDGGAREPGQRSDSLEQALDAAASSIGVFRSILDADGRFVDAEIEFMNDVGRRRWFDALPLDAVRGERVFARWPLLRPMIFDLYAAVAETGVARVESRELATADGLRVVDLSISPSPGGFLHIGRDVTDDRLAAAALHASDERLRRTVESLDAIVGFQDEPDGPLLLHGQVERILGYRADELRTYASWHELIHPDDLPECEAAWAPTGGSWNLTYRIRRADGAWTWVGDRGRQNRPGETARPVSLGVIVDVTPQRSAAEALRISEARLRRMIEGIDAIVSYQEPGRGPATLSPQVERILGWTPDEVGSFQAWDAIIHPDDIRRCKEVWSPTDAVWDFEYRVRRKDGTWAWISDRGRRLGPDDDRSLGMFGVITDVTARREAEEALRESREMLAQAQRVARVGSWSWRPATDEIEWSDELYRIYGMDPSMPPASMQEQERLVADPTDLARLREAVGRLVEDGEPFAIAYDIVSGDGRVHHVVGHAEAVRDEGDAIVLVRGTVADETELRRTRLALQVAQDRLAAVLGAVRESISILQPVRDADGEVIDSVVEWVNDAWRERFGWQGRNPVGRRIFEVHPELSWHLPVHRDVLATGTSRRVDTRLVSGRWIETDFSVFGERLLAVARDITDRKAAERQLEEGRADLAEAQRIAHVGSWTYDPGNGSWMWSDEIHRILGMEPDGLTHTTDEAARFVEPGAFAGVLAALDGAVRGLPFDVEIEVRRLDGVARCVQLAGERVPTADGNTLVRGSFADITALRAAQARLDQAQRTEMVGRLAGGVAHDFNNLLAAIGGHAEFLETSLPSGDPRLADVTAIRVATGRAAALTRRLLAFGRAHVLRPERLDLDDVVVTLAPLLRSLCGEQVTLELLPSGEACRVHADRAALEEAVINLVLNAKESLSPGGRITIRTATEEVGADFRALREPVVPGLYARLEISDTGSGIAPGVLPHIFEPFYTTKDPGSGAGLGLGSVEGAVARSNGLLVVETEVGRGSSFSILLPAARSSGVDGPAASATTDRTGRRRSVLVVDDEAVIRALVRRMVESLGYEVTDADGPAAALAIATLRAEPFDALVTDLLMPDMNGHAMAAQLRASWPDLPVIYMSAYSPETVFANGMLPSSTPFLSKPFAKDDLARVLAAALDPSWGSSTLKGE